MESLLRWSIQNSAPEDATGPPQPPPRKNLDPAIIDHILGKPDAVVMREAMAVALDKSRDEDDRVAALDEFEMLIENIDNATDMAKLGMWEPLHGILVDADESDLVKRQALWVAGTAVQNNPSAQHSYLSHTPVPTLLSFFSPSTPPQTRAKAVYALSGAVKHSALGVSQLSSCPHGWSTLRSALKDSDINVRRKTAFLLNTLLVPSSLAVPSTQSTSAAIHTNPPNQDPVHANTHASMLSDPTSTDTSTPTRAAFREHGILGALLDSLLHPLPYGANGDSEGDVDFEEKAMCALMTYIITCHGYMDPDQKSALRTYLDQDRTGVRWNLSADELRALYGAL